MLATSVSSDSTEDISINMACRASMGLSFDLTTVPLPFPFLFRYTARLTTMFGLFPCAAVLNGHAGFARTGVFGRFSPSPAFS